MMDCPSCNGPGSILPLLGPETWYSCQDCGHEWTPRVGRDPDEERDRARDKWYDAP